MVVVEVKPGIRCTTNWNPGDSSRIVIVIAIGFAETEHVCIEGGDLVQPARE